MSREDSPRADGVVKLYDERGYGRFPADLRKELGIAPGVHEIPYICHTNSALLMNPNVSTEDIIASLDVLKEMLKLRTKH